jgi:imidazolonepropionase-like amidohydrolase
MENYLAIKCGKLIDGTGNDPIDNSIVVIGGSKIVEVGESVTIPNQAKVIDASDKTVMPGLIDGHVHLNADPLLKPYERLLAPDPTLSLIFEQRRMLE